MAKDRNIEAYNFANGILKEEHEEVDEDEGIRNGKQNNQFKLTIHKMALRTQYFMEKNNRQEALRLDLGPFVCTKEDG